MTTQLVSDGDNRVLRHDDVLKLLRIGRSTLHRLRRSGDFPQPTSLCDSGRHLIWSAAEVNAWWREREAARAVALARRREGMAKANKARHSRLQAPPS